MQRVAPILAEPKEGGKYFIPVTEEGQPSWKLGQAFMSTTDEVFYGLGQHQDGLMDQKEIPGRTGPEQYRKIVIPFMCVLTQELRYSLGQLFHHQSR